MCAPIPQESTTTANDDVDNDNHEAAIERARHVVDEIDTQIIALLQTRQQHTDNIGRLKQHAAAIPAYERLLPMLSRRAEIASTLGLDADFVARLFELIAQHSMTRQQAIHQAVRKELPLIYSCSGCSSVAQLANDLAIAMDRERRAEMSCVAGVGAGVGSLTKRAARANKRVVVDGCALACAKICLQQQGLDVDEHVVLSELGIRKCSHQNYTVQESILARQHLSELLGG